MGTEVVTEERRKSLWQGAGERNREGETMFNKWVNGDVIRIAGKLRLGRAKEKHDFNFRGVWV